MVQTSITIRISRLATIRLVLATLSLSTFETSVCKPLLADEQILIQRQKLIGRQKKRMTKMRQEKTRLRQHHLAVVKIL